MFGTVNSITPKGIANVTWVEDGSINYCKLRDLTVVKSKRNVKSILAGIIALLVKGKPIKKKTPVFQNISLKCLFDKTGVSGLKPLKRSWRLGTIITQSKKLILLQFQ